MDFEIPAGVKMTPELYQKAYLMHEQGHEDPVSVALKVPNWKEATCSFCEDTFLIPSSWQGSHLCADCQAD